MIEQLLKSFYHKGRKTFVPWTYPEIRGRAGVPVSRLSCLLGQCRANGLMDKVKTNTPDASAWGLTPKGILLAQKYIDGEAFLKTPLAIDRAAPPRANASLTIPTPIRMYVRKIT